MYLCQLEQPLKARVKKKVLPRVKLAPSGPRRVSTPPTSFVLSAFSACLLFPGASPPPTPCILPFSLSSLSLSFFSTNKTKPLRLDSLSLSLLYSPLSTNSSLCLLLLLASFPYDNHNSSIASMSRIPPLRASLRFLRFLFFILTKGI